MRNFRGGHRAHLGFEGHCPRKKIHPVHQITYETENYFGYINGRIKKDYISPAGFEAIDKGLHQMAGTRLAQVKFIHESGRVEVAYKRPPSILLPGDAETERMASIDVKFAGQGNALLLVLGFGNIRLADPYSQAQEFLSTYFLGQDDKPIRFSGYTYYSVIGSPHHAKFLKQKGHHAYARTHSEAAGSPIEAMMEKELVKRGISFEKQCEIQVDGKKFTVVDFYIPGSDIVLYCDGTEFHKEPQRIIMDKTQDRKLQALGYIVFRFSGSEIHASVSNCVTELVKMMKLRAGDKA